MAKKLLFLIADGMGDRPDPNRGGLTPLMAAHTPNMDAMAARAHVGACATIPDDLPPGSDIANMALMGFDPARWHTGRGPIEAAAQGLDLRGDDLVWRLNLVTVSDFSPKGVMLDYSAGHIGTGDALDLVMDISAEVEDDVFQLYAGVQYRHLLVQQRGFNEMEAKLHVRPPHDILDQSMAEDFETFARSPRLFKLLKRAHKVLSRSSNATKANAVWPWGQGMPLSLPRFADQFHLKGAVISAVDLVKGLGLACGMEVMDVAGATGLLDTNYEGKVEAALDFLSGRGDFVFLHVEAPDECGHSGVWDDKVEAIRRFDERIVGPLRDKLPDAAFMVTCDHLTPLAIRTHCHGPVPFLLSWPGAPTNELEAFNEKTAAETGLTVDAGHELMGWTLDQLGWSRRR